jgi:hypothetical protein
VNRGPDEKPFTDDDVDLFQVRPRWGLAEFKVRENDDDLAYVGSIDPVTGVFTPNVDGPNPKRKWQANNVGDVFVTAEVELEVAVRPKPPKPAEKAPDAAKPDQGTQGSEPPPAPNGEGHSGEGTTSETPAQQTPAPQNTAQQAPAQQIPAAQAPFAAVTPPIEPQGPPPKEKKIFHARGHLIVTVPIYVRWAALDWEDR